MRSGLRRRERRAGQPGPPGCASCRGCEGSLDLGLRPPTTSSSSLIARRCRATTGGFTEAELTTITCNDAGIGIGDELEHGDRLVLGGHPGQAILIQRRAPAATAARPTCTGTEPGGSTDAERAASPPTTATPTASRTRSTGAPTPSGEGPAVARPPDAGRRRLPRPHRFLHRAVAASPRTGCPANADGYAIRQRARLPRARSSSGRTRAAAPTRTTTASNRGRPVSHRRRASPPTACPDADARRRVGRGGQVPHRGRQRLQRLPGAALGARFPDRWLGFPSSTRVLQAAVRRSEGRARSTCAAKAAGAR